jgi:hypothetical protein
MAGGRNSSIPKEAWGNRGGWITATAAGVVLLALTWTLASGGSMTQPTALGRDASKWSSVELPAEAVALADDVAIGEGDAGRTYDAILRTIDSNIEVRRALERYIDRRQTRAEPADDVLEPVFARFTDVTQTRGATLFADEPTAVINFDRQLPKLDRLSQLGRAATRHAGALVVAGDEEQARELYEASLLLGVHLAEERLVHRQWQYGIRLIGDALGGLRGLAVRSEDSGRAAKLKQASDALSAYVRDTTTPVWNAIGTANNAAATDRRAETHFGDVAAIAQSPEADPMWRTEALLRLGKYRYGATRPADRSAAERILERLGDEVDGPVRTAAMAARDLDGTTFRIAR